MPWDVDISANPLSSEFDISCLQDYNLLSYPSIIQGNT